MARKQAAQVAVMFKRFAFVWSGHEMWNSIFSGIGEGRL